MSIRYFASFCLFMAGIASAAVKFPFPSKAAYAGTAMVVSDSKKVSFKTTQGTAYTSADKAAALKGRFLEWKGNLYVEDGDEARIKFDDPSYTVSEGIGYGMLLMVYFSDNTTSYESEFQKLWNYYSRRTNDKGVMDWKIAGFDTSCSGDNCNGATDAEVDVAMALILGYHQYGKESYKTAALTLLDNIYKYEVETNSTQNGYAGILRPGDAWNSYYNVSYFSAALLGMAKTFDSNNPSRWDAVLKANHKMLKGNTHATSGLVTDWCDAAGTPVAGKSSILFKSDAVRTPWRMSIAASWFGDGDAASYATKVGKWIYSQTGGTSATKIYAEYNHNGTATQEIWSNSQYLGAFGSAMVYAKTGQTLIDNVWNRMMTKSDDAGYFNASLRLLTGLYMSGYMPNFANDVPVAVSSSSVASSSSVVSSSSVSSSSVTSSSSISSSSVGSSSSVSSSISSASSSSASSGPCIAFVNGTGGYKDHCYSSGLTGMAEGTCYTQTSATNETAWIAGNATDTYWWAPTSCGTEASLRPGLDLPLFAQISGRQFSLQMPRSGIARVQAFSLTGKQESTLYSGEMAAGSHSFSLSGLKAGMYLVRVQSAAGSLSQTVFLRD